MFSCGIYSAIAMAIGQYMYMYVPYSRKIWREIKFGDISFQLYDIHNAMSPLHNTCWVSRVDDHHDPWITVFPGLL